MPKRRHGQCEAEVLTEVRGPPGTSSSLVGVRAHARSVLQPFTLPHARARRPLGQEHLQEAAHTGGLTAP
jgi:hypothetical protein